eukprot:CAMPEP_0183704856 /NCGR_PEP_ID=MMETSP0737-20130205/2107_1 /TAXON_ID=385413 /ORGANISM="Thalassiosira miniscula, Strain CCMP1093" /LENGTH=238 /DNA_ID=CAMNT_0025931875 /DNA_START=61 /DNA_END=777 /DNA_ORIENTATION=+
MKPLKYSLFAIISACASSTASGYRDGSPAPFKLPDLPYEYDALEPIISQKTLTTHHTKHHAKYVNTANQLILRSEDATLKTLSQEEIIKKHKDNPGLYNNVAQSWNHSFYWHCMKPGGGGEPLGMLADAITKDFGSYEYMRNEMETAALTAFGSGWAWLGYDTKKGKLVVTKTTGAGNPMTDGIVPVLTIDVWEHAYYLDYQEKRAAYVKAFFDKLVDWEKAELNFGLAPMGSVAAEL